MWGRQGQVPGVPRGQEPGCTGAVWRGQSVGRSQLQSRGLTSLKSVIHREIEMKISRPHSQSFRVRKTGPCLGICILTTALSPSDVDSP